MLYTSDTFNPHQPDDALRAKVADQQLEIDHALRDLAAHVGLALIDLPHGCTTAERVCWASARLAEMGLLPR